ncbi:MAG: lysylphosphatidylglycerol synthase transmembrane domain-containing protein [Salinivenus sp.]
MTDRLRRRLLQIGSFVLAAGLLALALYGVDLTKMGTAFRKADWRWLVPLAVLVLGSNLCRAWRWEILIEALPTTPDFEALDEDRRAPSHTLEASFSSIMIGYMVNYVAPRMGEVARTANMSARSSYRFSSLFGTVVSERIFDTAVLGLALLSGIALLFDRLPVLREQFLEPAWATIAGLPTGWIVGGTLAVLVLTAVAAAGLRVALADQESAVGRFWQETVKPTLLSFKDGMMTLLRSPRRVAISVSTVGMWAGYLLMAYIPFRMLDLAGPYGIGLTDAWALMAIGALGLLVPTPGGIGSYHYITTEALVHLYGVPEASALTYAVLTHAAQFVFYILTGGIALLYQGTGLETLSARDQSDQPTAESSPA